MLAIMLAGNAGKNAGYVEIVQERLYKFAVQIQRGWVK
jgi:hypothetical protein